MAEHVDVAPLRADARRNRARILEAAREVFASEGLAVPIDTVAARAGIGVGTVYRHFPTKEALFAAIVTDRVEELATDARDALEADDPGAALFAFLTTMAERSAADMALADAFAAAGVDLKSGIGVCKQHLYTALGDLLQRAQDAGAVRTDVTVSDVMVLLSGTCIACGRQGVEDASPRLVGVVLDGLRPRS
jgi:AcrR family transcriptional regulator